MLNTMSPPVVRLRVPEILDQRAISTREFALKAGLTYNQALAMRRGQYAQISLDVLTRVCKALNVTPAELFDYENTDTK